ncbi:S1C family serine protease [Advenella mimigardefordensis]|uniref:Trypsin-like serine protease n=1 Tax=Advenella mimigardefordensis (strain DSM 17166 / LMG 22922 / DPN7) TaxID=1247726 RepID=W0PAS5_ADVMD|nr:trypsin-like peptidase domain-containing protein [Advenella mimigardefordensis]AHG62597.1 trypsin-like serine protease [Advenella mimigardefordensis DPN7]
MYRFWLLLSQAVTVCLALVFTITTLRPGWLTPGASDNPRVLPSTVLPSAVESLSFASAVAAATPSVVNIYTTKNIESPFKNLPDVPALKPFIKDNKDQNTMGPTNLGSGVIASDKGYILTNYHVIEAADSIEVGLTDGRKAPAKLIGTDPDTDLAVLKADLPDLPVIHYNIGNTPRIGDVVLAIGNPFGVGQTTTMGIVSALGRTGLGINTYENFIQTDAAINPGNSGGALINTHGDLIGINTAIYTESDAGGSLGIGFATPADTAMRIMDEIIKTGSVSRGWLGIEPQDITTDLSRAFNLKNTNGVIIATLAPNGPAGQAGLLVGDILLAANGEEIAGTDHLLNKIAEFAPQSKVTFTVLRGGKKHDFIVTLGKRPQITTTN